MIIYNSLEAFKKNNKPLVVTLGNFDGVHLGHRNNIKHALQIAHNINGEVMVFTFSHHPQNILGREIKLINTFDQKVKLIEELGVDKLLAPSFSKKISKLSPNDFVKKILHDLLDVKHVIVGFNYSFGYLGEGKADDLVNLNNNYGISTTIINPVYIKNEIVSSTRIREYLLQGNINKATELLSYKPILNGEVIHGNKLGRTIGFPTMNLAWEKELLIPATGVYAIEAIIKESTYKGVLNIGYKPTVQDDKRLSIEANLFDFSKEVYNQEVQIVFHKRLRAEKKFNNIDELKNQIAKDVLEAQMFFSNE